MDTQAHWVLEYPTALAAGPNVVGGKGWNLARLDHFGFLVPRGGVLIAEAYRRWLQTGDLPAEAIAAFLARSDLQRRPLAVRSSATAEDSPRASFAGVHESVLNVCGVEAVLDAIRTCFASVSSARAAAYRQRMRLADSQVACAVLLCEMVPHVRAAGVVFTADPRTGRRDRVVVSAGFGLGTTVVGGEVNPQEVEIDSGLAELRVARALGPRVLSDHELARLARLAVRVEWALGEGQTAQDVEFAFDGERHWLVQARPITNLPRPAMPIQSGQPTLWSDGNLKDALAGVPTTASWSFVATYLNYILYAPFRRIGFRLPLGAEAVRRFEGRAYLDLSLLQAVFFDALGSSAADTNFGLGGPSAELELPAPTPALRRRWLMNRVRLLLLLLREQGHYQREIARVRAAARHYRAIVTYPDIELARVALEIAQLQLDFGPRFQLGNMAAGVWGQLLAATLERLRPGHGLRLAAALMAGSGEVVTAEHAYRLYEIAHAPDPERALDTFLEEFGHRGVYEGEIANARWREDPTFLREQIAQLRSANTPPREVARARRREAEHEIARFTLPWRLLVGWIAGRARRAAALREAGKSALIALVEPVRFLTLEVGGRMVASGALNAPEDVFHLSRADLDAFVRGEWDGTGARALVAGRRMLREQRMASRPPPDLIVEDHLTLEGEVARSAGESADERSQRIVTLEGERTLRGLAAAAGRASGPARLIHDPTDADRLRDGDVLVAPSTDPGWTPLFLRCSAVVTEVGGYLSHGAIVAREFGLPAVVNVPGIMSTLRDGEPITVDGDAGLVRRSGLTLT